MDLSIETPRLILRPFVEADAATLAALSNDDAIARMVCSMPHPHVPLLAEGWILIQAANRARGRDAALAIFDRASHMLIGSVGAHARSDGRYEVGYWIGRPYWGLGYASEALQALIAHIRRRCTGVSFSAGHFADNPASRRVLEKAGFRPTGAVERRFSLGRAHKVDTVMMEFAPDMPVQRRPAAA
jgi:RimJ/RimL family protein N-acetyltransferase